MREELESELGKKWVPSLLFIGLGQLRENGLSIPGVDKEPTRKHHVEGHDELTQGQFRPTCGVGRPLVVPPWSVLLCGGCSMGPKVGPRCPRGFEAIFLTVGPSILGMSMCRPLIRWGCFPWISDMACMHGILGRSPSLAEMTWLDL
jgi:hypothetical protein